MIKNMNEISSFECPFATQCRESCDGPRVTNVVINPGGMYDDHATITLSCDVKQEEGSVTVDNPDRVLYTMARAFRESRVEITPNS
jgi:hypothetical protein